MTVIRGSVFDKAQTEVQLFPEEYFSAADCHIYFADVYNDQITGLQFTLTEKVLPVFGYSSRTWQHVLRGNRVVVGSFRMAFREAGYLYTILDHIGQHQLQSPALGYMMTGQEVPKWHGQAKQTIEMLLKHWSGPSSNPQRKKVPRWSEATLKQGMTGNGVRELQTALAEYGFYFGAISGTFDAETTEAVRNFQRGKGLAISGVADAAVKNALAKEEIVSGKSDGGQAVDMNATFEPRVLQYEKDIWGRPFLSEAEDLRSYETFFYRGRKTETAGDHTSYLYQNGFDIYINYGPMADFAIQNGGVGNGGTFNTTVKAIRNIQLTDVSQVIDPRTGEVIEEQYQFIARDLD